MKTQDASATDLVFDALRRASVLLTVLLIATLAGCSSSAPISYNYQSDQTMSVYETDEIKLSKFKLNSGYNSPPQIHVIARGTCDGPRCTPSDFTLRFTIEQADQRPVRVSSSNIVLRTDNDELRIDSGQDNLREEGTVLMGTFSRFAIERDRLEDLATSEEVSGQIGNLPFQISKQERASLVALLNAPESLNAPDTDA